MKCMACGGETKVLDTASNDDHVARRRKCLKCGTVFFTSEDIVEYEEGRKDVNRRQNKYILPRI